MCKLLIILLSISCSCNLAALKGWAFTDTETGLAAQQQSEMRTYVSIQREKWKERRLVRYYGVQIVVMERDG